MAVCHEPEVEVNVDARAERGRSRTYAGVGGVIKAPGTGGVSRPLRELFVLVAAGILMPAVAEAGCTSPGRAERANSGEELAGAAVAIVGRLSTRGDKFLLWPS